MEQLITYAIYAHAFLGGVGLITGIGSMIIKKGSTLHKRMGKLFSIGMIGSASISLPIAWMPGHENLFLFLIGLFTIYLVLAGNRSLTFKPRIKKKAAATDLAISFGMLIFSLIMLGLGAYGLIAAVTNSILYLVFGGFGLFLTIRDFMFYKRFKDTKNDWLLNHITRMMAALIASVTAFVVAGLGIGSLAAWILPSVFGTLYIIYWRRKMKVRVA
ncbi:hypothetical protein FGM00_03980 [Aggregatimonas sangjinii]|uniref:DUF2306 domain-containing protein n=1 Tax=Aggregatimonas sangjinii TaxID=2583587 RepID=A0A5B7SQT8_9FLAO|nr:hypothetical protein [Aggregatimonas sangjinii]QCW99309.1 hypothetical protein FGM00_03980 [Aggregatimonas sangjinii]